MLYNCPDGKTLNMSTELYFSLSDLELSELCTCNRTMEIQDPFFESSITPEGPDDNESDNSPLEDYPEDLGIESD